MEAKTHVVTEGLLFISPLASGCNRYSKFVCVEAQKVTKADLEVQSTELYFKDFSERRRVMIANLTEMPTNHIGGLVTIYEEQPHRTLVTILRNLISKSVKCDFFQTPLRSHLRICENFTRKQKNSSSYHANNVLFCTITF
ncbi:uncharacterized protein LOC144645963 [Oculina patagonica]